MHLITLIIFSPFSQNNKKIFQNNKFLKKEYNEFLKCRIKDMFVLMKLNYIKPFSRLHPMYFNTRGLRNMQQKTLVAHRIICDHVNRVGGVMKVPITNELLVSVSSARLKYEQYLSTARQEKATVEQTRERKTVYKKHKKQIQTDQDHLESSADKLLDQAEQTGKMVLVAEANSLRTAKDKKDGLILIVKKIEDAVTKLKNI